MIGFPIIFSETNFMEVQKIHKICEICSPRKRRPTVSHENHCVFGICGIYIIQFSLMLFVCVAISMIVANENTWCVSKTNGDDLTIKFNVWNFIDQV